MKRKSVWDEKPLNKVDLLKIVEEEQSKDSKLTKMDIFRKLSKKYKKILTPDQFNFRYNYLISKQRKLEARRKSAVHVHVQPVDIEDIKKHLKPVDYVVSSAEDNRVEVSFKPYKFVIGDFRDDKQQLLDINKAMYSMIDSQKFVRFCDKQVQLQRKRKASGGINLVFKRLSELYNQKYATISSRYYNSKARKNKAENKIQTLEDLEDKVSELMIENSRLIDEVKSLTSDYQRFNQLKQRPLIKLSLFIESIINSIKGDKNKKC